MEVIDKIKVGFVAVFTTINTLLGAMAMPVYLLVCVNILDYFTGIAASHCRGEATNSRKGVQGIIKKVCMWFLVIIGFILDYSVVHISSIAGIDIKFNCLIGAAVVFWLVFNELISILENIQDVGTELPPFLLKIVELMKGKKEEAVKIDDIKVNKE